ncbi:hypothetical protein BCR44DRAFT_1424658 [Catenaria anguillulae PL171]|uniref:Uncharacterized protein n=1 Tax=Catenaria anguillulae PL171 TaxID=765915 RepID=A0A1Y2I1Y4_9FUNG|nr:hypothetical protein BCR44DRAFT_1424658 [Catenaria anguillulae PL171]
MYPSSRVMTSFSAEADSGEQRAVVVTATAPVVVLLLPAKWRSRSAVSLAWCSAKTLLYSCLAATLDSRMGPMPVTGGGGSGYL